MEYINGGVPPEAMISISPSASSQEAGVILISSISGAPSSMIVATPSTSQPDSSMTVKS